MPIYEYFCKSCGSEFEELVMKDETPLCPDCGANSAERLISACARHKGDKSGGYESHARASGCSGCSGGNCASCCH